MRFNFRGVGRSQGTFDSGAGELSDAAAVLDWMNTLYPNPSFVWVCGISFGAWIGMQLLMRRPEITGFVSIAPPASMYDFAFLAPCPTSGLIRARHQGSGGAGNRHAEAGGPADGAKGHQDHLSRRSKAPTISSTGTKADVIEAVREYARAHHEPVRERGGSPDQMPRAPNFRSEFLRIFVERGAYYDCSAPDDLDRLFLDERVTAYIGFDCTAPSLHVGSLVQLMTLRRLQQAGHKPILLMGGGTTKIGDPSGKDETRLLLSDEQIEANKQSILRGVQHLLKFGDGPSDALMVDNAEWLDGLDYIPFLREIGRHFSVNRMLSMESVKLRLDREQPMSFLEFNYSIMQAYDFVELNRRYGCRLQSGGSDQWGNVVSGIDLGRRIENVQLFGLTTPLITTASGAKMGKTAAGAVWLNADQLIPYDYWQFWRNTEDKDVGRFLRLFTDLAIAEIARLEEFAGRAS